MVQSFWLMRVSFTASTARSSLRQLRRAPWICTSCRRQSSLVKVDLTPPNNHKPYYVTTPIYYVNAAPHIGHLYSSVLADIIKRWQLLSGRNAILCTGTDEHGMKVQQAATKAGSQPKMFCDKGVELFKTLARRAEISYDHFIRTTDPKHVEAVQYAWYVLKNKGLIYTSKHEGWYAVSDETFYPESRVHLILDPSTGRKHMASIETGNEVEWTTETNYHFRLSAFRGQLLEFYQQNPAWINPPSRMKQVVQAVTAGLEDLSISRPRERLSWGIPVPDDPSQTIYVWLDALINYITEAGYPWAPGKGHIGGWPADCHVIGKDILRFHCIYWPAFLMALQIPLPAKVVAHAHWTMDKQKMSKSVGNVVNPFFALDRFGPDVMRFYLAYDGRIADDADYDNFQIIGRYKKVLAGGLGNLTSRITRGKGWNLATIVKDVVEHGNMATPPRTAEDEKMWRLLKFVHKKIEEEMQSYDIPGALDSIMHIVTETNKYLQSTSPWNLLPKYENAPIDPRLPVIIFLCAEALRIVGIMLQPFIPGKAAEMLDLLGVDENKRMLPYATLCTDDTYGKSKRELGKGRETTLFPPLINDG